PHPLEQETRKLHRHVAFQLRYYCLSRLGVIRIGSKRPVRPRGVENAAVQRKGQLRRWHLDPAQLLKGRCVPKFESALCAAREVLAVGAVSHSSHPIPMNRQGADFHKPVLVPLEDCNALAMPETDGKLLPIWADAHRTDAPPHRLAREFLARQRIPGVN